MKTPKYEYFIHTWGGFYQYEHEFKSGSCWFDTKEERDKYLNDLKDVEKKLNARHLAYYLDEGYCTREHTVLHRVVEYQGERIYSQYNIDWCYDYSSADYHQDHKWFPGFNDYAVCKYFNLDEDQVNWNDVKIIQEWTTGAFSFFKEWSKENY